jgi:hypothetical protein
MRTDFVSFSTFVSGGTESVTQVLPPITTPPRSHYGWPRKVKILSRVPTLDLGIGRGIGIGSGFS